VIATRLPTVVLALLVALGLLAAGPPASASASSTGADVVGALSRGDDATSSGWGKATAAKQRLRDGCRGYPFRYVVDVPGDAWMAEITLVNPRGREIASRTYQSTNDPARAKRRFRFCDVSTEPGRHSIRMLVTSYDYRAEHERRSDPTIFRLTRR